MRKLNFLWAIILLSVILTSCSEDEPDVTDESRADVIVINEGNFQSGDGTFSSYNTDTEEVNFSLYASANGFPVGATIQSAQIFGDNIYAVTNGPDKLEIFDAETFESIAYITSGFANPYAFAAVDDKGYVTNWGTLNTTDYSYENPFITVIDLTTNAVTDSLMLEGKPQDIVAVNGFFYVSNVGGSSISVIDAATDEIVKEIAVADNPDDLVVDVEGDVWVIANSGNIVKIDTETNMVEKTISGIEVAGFNETMVISEDGQHLYWLSSVGEYPNYTTSVYELNISATTAPEDAIVSGTTYYGLGISPENILYVADANAFQGNGSVIRYNLDGTELNTFAAGRGPAGFIFR